jgi:hypothetical protein
MGYRITEPHVRVRTTLRHEWIWELITDDGHVAYVSDTYRERDPCEAEARSHGLRIVGGKRQVRGGQKPRRAPGVCVSANSRGLWYWEHVGDAGDILAASPVAFLSRDDCERDAVRCLGSIGASVETA